MDFNMNQIEEYNNQIRYKIINSKISNYPFPHAETTDILPTKLLEGVEKNFPNKDEFISLTKSNIVKVKKDKDNKHPYDFRYLISLTEKNEISRIKGSRYDFWKFFTKTITSPLVTGSLLDLYKKFLQEKFGENLKNTLFYPHVLLMHDKANYSLGPHTDVAQKAIVILIYLSSDNSKSNTNSYGTSIYIPKNNGFACDGTRHHQFKDFYRLFTSSFNKNNSLSFFRTNNSFHGVEKLVEKPIERRLLQISIMSKLKEQ